VSTDLQLLGFMQALAANVRGKNGVLLTDWESKFLASFLHSSRPSLWFTSGRRGPTDLMWKRYGAEINHPHPSESMDPTASGRPDANGLEAHASPDGCEFWIKDADRRPCRCNETAELVGRRGLRYCRMHADEVIKNMKRAGKSIELRPFKAGLTNQ